MFNKKNLPLIIALSIPVIMIIIIAAAIYLPGINKKPKINFIYVSGSGVYYSNYYYDNSFNYSVRNNKVEKIYYPENVNNPKPTYPPNTIEPKLFLYDVVKNESTELTLEQAQTYSLDTSNQSLDGYTVSRGNNGGGDFLFNSVTSDYNSWFIKGHNRSWKLNLKLIGNDSYSNFLFLGWTGRITLQFCDFIDVNKIIMALRKLHLSFKVRVAM